MQKLWLCLPTLLWPLLAQAQELTTPHPPSAPMGAADLTIYTLEKEACSYGWFGCLLQDFQGFAGGVSAIIAAVIAWRAVSKQVKAADRREAKKQLQELVAIVRMIAAESRNARDRLLAFQEQFEELDRTNKQLERASDADTKRLLRKIGTIESRIEERVKFLRYTPVIFPKIAEQKLLIPSDILELLLFLNSYNDLINELLVRQQATDTDDLIFQYYKGIAAHLILESKCDRFLDICADREDANGLPARDLSVSQQWIDRIIAREELDAERIHRALEWVTDELA